MLRVVLGLAFAGCTFSAPIGGDGEPGELRTVTDDELAGTAVDGVVVGGNVEPDGFVLGGLHARGYQVQLVDNGEDIAKILTDASTAIQLGAAYAQVPMHWPSSRPKGLGLVNDSSFTVIYDGEILLPKGEVKLEAMADDRAVVELMGMRLANTGSVTFTVPEGGWYPIQAALTQASGTSRLELTIVQDQERTTVDGARLRARVTDARGLVVFAFDQERFVAPHGQVTRPTIAEAFSVVAPPFDLDTPFDHFSLRFAGQLKIDAPGPYEFDATIDTDDNWRLWIDGTLVAHRWLGLADVTVGTVDLTPGWHSILVDYNDNIGGATIAVRMKGPDAPMGGTIDPMRLRPVVPFGNTYTVATTAATEIKDAGSTFITLALPGEPTELIDAVDYAFRIDNQVMSTLEVTLFDCTAGKTLTTGTLPGYFYYAADKTCAGKVTNPAVDWQLRLTDTTAGSAPLAGLGSVRDYGLSALYHGGPKMPFAPVVTYTSEPQSTPGAKRITAARAIGTLTDTAIEISVRVADDAAGLEAQPFEVVGEDAKIAAGEVLQYRVTLSTNGWISPVLEKVEIDYVILPE